MKIGNASFNTESLSKMTRKQFVERYAGKIGSDVNAAAEKLSEYFMEEEVILEEIQEEVVYTADLEEAPKRKRRRK